MNKGLLAFYGALFLTGCSGSSDDSSEVKLIINDGYAAYSIDNGSWIEIRDEVEVPAPSNFDTLSLLDVCTFGGSYENDINISILKAESVLSRINNKSELELGCIDFEEDSEVKPPSLTFNILSENPNVFITEAYFRQLPGTKNMEAGDNISITFETTKQNHSGPLFAIGKNEASEYFIHLNNDFLFADSNTYTIDFYGENSSRSIADQNLDSEEFSYGRSVLLDGNLLPLTLLEHKNVHLRPLQERFFPENAIVSEYWSTNKKYNGFELSVKLNNASIQSQNPLPNIVDNISELSATYNDDMALHIIQTPTNSSFIQLPNKRLISYYRFNSGDIRYETEVALSNEFTIPSPTDFYELPNFPEEAKMDINTLEGTFLYIIKDNEINAQKVGYESYVLEKFTYF